MEGPIGGSQAKPSVEGSKIEAWIIEKAKSGDLASQEALLKHYESRVFDLILRIVNNYEDAKDVLQDTFVKAIVNIRRFDTRYDFGRWLMCIATRTSFDLLRKRRRQRTLDLEAADIEQPIQDLSYEQQLEARINYELITKSMERLDPRYRAVLLLRYRDEFSYSEISEALGIPIGSVKVLLHRAHGKLKEVIGKEVGKC